MWRTDHLGADGRCLRRNGDPLPSGRPVVLTTAHLDHRPENCADENLMAMCQACHLTYDREHHAASRAATAAAARDAAHVRGGQSPLFELPAR